MAVAADAAYTVRIGTDGCHFEDGGEGCGGGERDAKATPIDVMLATATAMDPAWPVGSFRLRLGTTYGRGVARELLARRKALGAAAVALSGVEYEGEAVAVAALPAESAPVPDQQAPMAQGDLWRHATRNEEVKAQCERLRHSDDFARQVFASLADVVRLHQARHGNVPPPRGDGNDYGGPCHMQRVATAPLDAAWAHSEG